MYSIRSLALLLFSLSSFAVVASNASASTGENLSQFFQKAEGHWDGQGMVQELEADGHFQQTSYKMDLPVERGSEKTWNLSEQLNLETGISSQNTLLFTVQGDELIVSSNSLFEPVLVLDSTPDSFTYFMRRSDVWSGRVFDFTIHYSLDQATGAFAGHNTIETNGVVVTEGNFSLKHW